MGKTVYLVSGAAGFLGSHVCDELLERGEYVRVLVLPGDKSVRYVPKEVEIAEGDLCDVDSLERFFTVPKGEASLQNRWRRRQKRQGEKPMMTNFAVYNLARNNQFDYYCRYFKICIRRERGGELI